jgi:Flp pilus assembly protein TadD
MRLFGPNVSDPEELISPVVDSNLRSALSQQRRTQAARDSVGKFVCLEELAEHLLLLEAKSLGQSTARFCWFR